jgi:hypothetical protein
MTFKFFFVMSYIIGVIAGLIGLFRTEERTIKFLIILFLFLSGAFFYRNPGMLANAYNILIGKDGGFPITSNPIDYLPSKCEKCARRDFLVISLVSFSEEAVVLNVSNTSDKDASVSLVDLIKFEAGKTQIEMTTSGTIAKAGGIFTTYDMAIKDCINGAIPPEGRTIIQAHDVLKVPVRPRDSQNIPEIKPESFLNIPICYGIGVNGKGNFWMAQVPFS